MFDTTNEPAITSVSAIMVTKAKRLILLKYLLHMMGAKTGKNVLEWLSDKSFFNARTNPIKEKRPDEYHNPPNSTSKYWDATWIEGIIITINVPLPRNILCSFLHALHTDR